MREVKPIRIMIVDDHEMVREGLRLLLARMPGVEVLPDAANGRTAVELAKELLPDVVLMDITMPELNGIEATRRLTESVKGVKVIALSGHATARSAAEAIRCGASAFVRKEAAFKELKDALQAAVHDRLYISPAVSEAVKLELKNGEGAFGIELSSREREILQLIAEGRSTKEIAKTLQVSVKTIETHRRNLMLKVHLFSLAELTRYAVREGITPL